MDKEKPSLCSITNSSHENLQFLLLSWKSSLVHPVLFRVLSLAESYGTWGCHLFIRFLAAHTQAFSCNSKTWGLKVVVSWVRNIIGSRLSSWTCAHMVQIIVEEKGARKQGVSDLVGVLISKSPLKKSLACLWWVAKLSEFHGREVRVPIAPQSPEDCGLLVISVVKHS